VLRLLLPISFEYGNFNEMNEKNMEMKLLTILNEKQIVLDSIIFVIKYFVQPSDFFTLKKSATFVADF